MTNLDEMFGAVCNFIRKAANGGIIKPSVAVFRPRRYGHHDFRIWNPFLISYAGYLIEEEIPNPTGSGKITKIKKIGDQAKLEFTRVILINGCTLVECGKVAITIMGLARPLSPLPNFRNYYHY